MRDKTDERLILTQSAFDTIFGFKIWIWSNNGDPKLERIRFIILHNPEIDGHLEPQVVNMAHKFFQAGKMCENVIWR